MSTEEKDKNPIDEYLELIDRVKKAGAPSPSGTPAPTNKYSDIIQRVNPTQPSLPTPGGSRGAIASTVLPIPQQTNYDQSVSPVQGFLDKVFAMSAGGANVLNKTINEGAPTSMTGAFGQDRRAIMQGGQQAYQQQGLAAVPKPSLSPEQQYWIAGTSAAWNNDYSNPNLVWGADVVNNYFTSRGGEALNREDASFGERAGLFLGGLAIDILVDPLTYTPAGLVTAPIRGAFRAAQAAKGAAKVPAAIKGVYSGVDYKVGKFTGRPKPVGLRQWWEMRQYDSVASVAARQQIPLDDLFKVYNGKMTTEALAKSINTFTSGTPRATNYTAEDIKQIVKDLRQGGGLDSAQRMHYGASTSATGERYWAQPRTTSQPTAAGIRAYGAEPPRTQQNFNPWASMSDGVVPPPAGVHNTFGKTALDALNLPPTATYEDAGGSLINIMRNPDVPQAQKDAAFEAYQEIIETLPSNRNIGNVIENIIASISNPAVATKIAEKVADTPLETPGQQVAQLKTIIDELADADAAVGFQPQLAGLETPEMLTRGQIFEAFIDSVDSGINDVYTNSQRAKYRMLLDPDENLTEIFFGTNKAWSGIREAYMDRVGGIAEAGFDSVYNGIKALAELPIEIPGYSQRAREFVLRTEAADASERLKIINNLNRTYEESLVKVGALDDMGRPVNLSDMAWERIDEAGAPVTKAQKAFQSAEETGELQERPQTSLTGLDDPWTGEGGTKGPLDDLKAGEASEAATELGKFVNIFGDIVEDPAFDLTKALQSGTSKTIKDLDAGIDPAVASKELRRVLDAGEEFATTANVDGLKGADSILGRTLSTRRSAAAHALALKELVAPNVPRTLDDIYDHVVGFARVPLTKEEWVKAITRVAATDAAVAPRAIKLVKALGLDRPPIDAAKLQKAYEDYLKPFAQIRSLKVPEKLGGHIDETAGVDLFNRIFRNDYADVGYGQKNIYEYDAGKKKGFARELKARQAARLERGQTVAELGREIALGERRKLAGDKPGAPFTSRDKWQYSSLEDIAKDPILRRSTDGSWITSVKTLIKVVTTGDVAASAANLIENLKLSRKLDEGLKQILPGIRYNKASAEPKLVYEEMTLRKLSETSGSGTPQVVAQTRAALQTQSETILDILQQAAQRFAKTAEAPKNMFENFVQTLRGKRGGVEVFKYDEGRYIPDMIIDGRIVEGSKVPFTRDQKLVATEKLAYVNMEPVRGALDNVLDAAGVPASEKAHIRPLLWDSILKNMSPVKLGAVNVNFDKVIDDFIDAPFRTGNSRVAGEVEAEAGLTETILRNAGETLKKWNKEYGYNPPAQQTIKATEEEIDSHYIYQRSIKASETVEGYIDQVEKIFASLKLTHINVDPEWLRKTAEVIARNTADTKFDAQKSSGEVLFDYIKSKVPQLKGLLTESKVREIAQFDAINKYTLLNGDIIAGRAKSINPDELLRQTRKAADDQIAKIINKTEAEAVRAASLAGYRASIARLSSQGATKRVPGTRWRSYQQNAVYTAYKAAKSVIDQKFTPGTIENWNATIIASRDLRALLRESGIVETTVMRPFGGKIVPKETGDVDFSYTSWLDVMDASTNATGRRGVGSGLPEDVFRVALDLHKVDGLAFPQTVLAESGIMAMKMAGAGMDETTRIAWLYDFMKYQIGKIEGGKAYADDITADVSTATSKIVAMLARSIGSDSVIKNLDERHSNAGALAVAVAERNSSQISEPILRAVENVANNIYATPGDINKALSNSVDILRKELANRGYGKGSLEALISLKSLERVIADNVSANTISGARVKERMARAAENPATQRQAANAVRSDTAKSTREMADTITVQDLLGKLHQALKPEATETALENVIREIMHMSDYSIKTTQDLMQFVSQQPNTMRKPVVQAPPQTPGSPLTVRALGVVADKLDHERQPLGDAYFRLEADGVTGKELDEAFAAFDEVDQRYQAALAAYEAARDAGLGGATKGSINVWAGNGQNAGLSNFAPRMFAAEINGQTVEFPTVEHYFQAKKADMAGDIAAGRAILAAPTAYEAKRLGRTVKMTPEQVAAWNAQSSDVLYEGMTRSFLQNPEAAKILRETGSAKITHNPPTGRGDKWTEEFPKLLERVRKELPPPDAEQTSWGKVRPPIGGAKPAPVKADDNRIGDDIMGKGIEDSLDPEMARNLESFQNEGGIAELHSRLSLRAGQQDIATARTGAQSITDSVINTTEVRLEALARKFKKIPADVIGGLLARVAKLRTPEAKKTFIDSLPPEQQEFMQGFFWSIGHLFDSNTIARTGLDSQWIDKHLFQTQLASVGKARLSPRDRNVLGWDIETAYNKLIIDVLEAGPEGGGTDWLTLFKGLNQAIYDSTLVPNLAGDFSSRFGHEARGWTVEQAQKEGWVRIKTGEGAGDLARFLDGTQYFPPDIARQMANMQRMFGVKRQPDSLFGRKVLAWFDRVQGSVKSFLTLWQLSHHIVASMGEGAANIMAGESNPKNFGHALQVLAAGGDITKNPLSPFMHNKTREMDIFKELGFKTSDDDAKGLIRTVIQGPDGRSMKMTPAQIHDLFESYGIKMTNNTVEDYTYRNSQLVRDGNILRKAVSPIIAINRGLGHLASTRDNVFRFQHAIGILRGTNPRGPKVFKSLDEAKDYIQREIFEWHPTAQSLAPFERNIQRRLFLFYTWQRVALNRIMEAAIDDPFRLGIIPRVNQNLSAAMGGDPQSPGNPMPNDPRLPSFAQEHILGPAWYDQYGEVQSIAVNSPQLDLFQTFFGGFGIDKTMTAQENIKFNLTEIPKLIVPQLSPVFKLAIEGSTGTAISPGGPGPEITDWGQNISDMLGFSRQSIITGVTPLSDRGLFAPRDYNANSFSNRTPAEIEWERQRTTFNLLTGLKWDQKSRFWRSAQAEQQERYARFQRNLLNEQREERQ